MFMRTYALEDIRVRSGGDGRTVEAYAAIFNTPAEVRDRDGHYMEDLAPTVFNKTLAERGTRFGVFYNHAATLYGTPSERASVPLGSPLEVRADSRGLLTVTRYNKTPLADDVLEAIRNGDITGQSFSGDFLQSKKTRAASRDELPRITRTEIALKEYGPTPTPVYQGASILGVRSSLLAEIAELDEEARAEFARMLGLATPLEPATPPATPDPGAGAEEPRSHSARQQDLARRIKAARITRGML